MSFLMMMTSSISGNVGFSGVVLTAHQVNPPNTELTVVSDGAGNYSFTALPSDFWNITVAPTSGCSVPAPQQVVLNPNTDVTGVNFLLGCGVLLGFLDNGATTGLSGASVTLAPIGSTATSTPGSQVTGSRFNYQFINLQPGIYSATPSKSGCTFSPTSKSVTVLPGPATYNRGFNVACGSPPASFPRPVHPAPFHLSTTENVIVRNVQLVDRCLREANENPRLVKCDSTQGSVRILAAPRVCVSNGEITTEEGGGITAWEFGIHINEEGSFGLGVRGGGSSFNTDDAISLIKTLFPQTVCTRFGQLKQRQANLCLSSTDAGNVYWETCNLEARQVWVWVDFTDGELFNPETDHQINNFRTQFGLSATDVSPFTVYSKDVPNDYLRIFEWDNN